jgi:hypothetical protein
MRLAALLAVTVLVCLAAWVDGAWATEEATVTVERAAIRSGPSGYHKTLRHAKKGDRLGIEELEGAWVRLRGGGYVSIKDVRVGPASDPVAEREDAFIDWAIARGNIVELTVRDRGTVWAVLGAESYKSEQKLKDTARELACGYRRITGMTGAAVVTIWPESGVGERWAARETCK